MYFQHIYLNKNVASTSFQKYLLRLENKNVIFPLHVDCTSFQKYNHPSYSLFHIPSHSVSFSLLFEGDAQNYV